MDIEAIESMMSDIADNRKKIRDIQADLQDIESDLENIEVSLLEAIQE